MTYLYMFASCVGHYTSGSTALGCSCCSGCRLRFLVNKLASATQDITSLFFSVFAKPQFEKQL